MTKAFKKVLIAALLVCMAAAFVACGQSFEWGPVAGGDPKAVVENNGSLAVKQGDWLYYINGHDDTATLTQPSDNYFGEASVKGSIMKSKIGEDGALTETAVVVPKMFMTSYTSGGIYLFGEWIYYVTPTTKTDRDGVVQVDFLEYYRTKTDGTGTQLITMVEGASNQYVFTPSALIYYTGGTLYKVGYTATDVDKNATVIDENISSATFHHNGLYTPGADGTVKDYIFYTKASDSEDGNVYGNELYATNGGEPIKLIDATTWGEDGKVAGRENQFTISVLSIGDDADGVTLYYTKTAAAGADTSARTYGIKFTGATPSFDKTKEVKLCESSLSGIIHIGLDKGVAVLESNVFTVYNIKAGEDGFEVEVSSKADDYALSGSATTVKYDAENDMLYYIVSNNLYVAKGLYAKATNDEADAPYALRVSEDKINTSWLKPTIVNGALYYIDNTYGYTFSIDIPETFMEELESDVSEGKMASGYESSDKTEDGTIPKFMTDTDKETYITNNPAPEEEE